MKNLLCLTLFVLTTLSLAAQSNSEDIEKVMNAYYEALMANDIDGAIQFIPTDLHKKASKKKYEEHFKRNRSYSVFDVVFLNYQLEQVSEVNTKDDYRFSKVDYAITEKWVYDKEKINDPKSNLDWEGVKRIMGKFNDEEYDMICDDENYTITTTRSASCYAISGHGDDDWKIVRRTPLYLKWISKVAPDVLTADTQ